MECPICCETYDALLYYRCDKCNQTECLKCYQSWNKEECPFCRYSPVVANSVEIIYPQTYPGNYYVPHWETSRILTRQLRRERKRQEHELQQIRNAELSRIHNNNNRKTKKSKEKRQDIQFHIDDL
jgi:hypothetical protein